MTHHAPPTGGNDPRWRLTPTKVLVAVILLVGIVAPLLVGTYARAEPRLFGFPFFYWYQLLWVFVAAGLCLLSFVLVKRENQRLSQGPHRPGGDGDAPRRSAGGTR